MDKQIEEIKKDIAVRMAMAKGVAGSMNNGVEGWLSEYLIEKGWTQIPEKAVVLTREEYEQIQDRVELLKENEDIGNALFRSNELCRRLVGDKKKLKQELKQARKETAEKLLDKVDNESDGQTKAITDLLRKEYGVEVK